MSTLPKTGRCTPRCGSRCWRLPSGVRPCVEPLDAMRQLEAKQGGWHDPWLDEIYQTQMQLVNAVFRQHGEHKYAYDEETLQLILRPAGFSRVLPQRFGISIDRDMAPDSEARKTESLYVEAVK
jgi:hypothetical protein